MQKILTRSLALTKTPQRFSVKLPRYHSKVHLIPFPAESMTRFSPEKAHHMIFVDTGAWFASLIPILTTLSVALRITPKKP